MAATKKNNRRRNGYKDTPSNPSKDLYSGYILG